MPVENLKFGVESLQNEYNKINKKRQQWSDITVPLLENLFHKVVDTYDLNWEIEKENDRKNAEIIKLSLGKGDSGISEKTEFGTKSFAKFRGSLSFEQTYNGDIDIVIYYPYIQEITGPAESDKWFAKVAPANVDEELVYVQVGRFLTEITAWESGSSADKMGQ